MKNYFLLLSLIIINFIFTPSFAASDIDNGLKNNEDVVSNEASSLKVFMDTLLGKDTPNTTESNDNDS